MTPTLCSCFTRFNKCPSTFRMMSAVVGLGLNMLSFQLIHQNLVLLQNQVGLLLQLKTRERKDQTAVL